MVVFIDCSEDNLRKSSELLSGFDGFRGTIRCFGTGPEALEFLSTVKPAYESLNVSTVAPADLIFMTYSFQES